MKRAILVLLAGILVVPAIAASTGDVTEPIRQFLDGFNTGDVKSAYAAYSTGDITIVDEFPPHRWTGPNAAHAWAADYEKHAQATGVSDGTVKYGSPTRTEIKGNVAYVIIPTTYLYKEHGEARTENGQMTFVLHADTAGWKITSWTWTGEKPHPAK